MADPRLIVHADMDAFYAAIEQRDRPELRGRPVIVGGLGPRGVVSTASYEARRFAVHSAQPMAIARRRCPDAAFVTPRMHHYAEVSAQVFEVFERFTPLVEPMSLDEAFLDVTASQALFGSGEEIAHRLQAAVHEATRLTVSVGVASNKFVAKVASDLRKPAGVVCVPPGTEAEFLGPLPVSRLWGAGPQTCRSLAARGLHTIADVRCRTEDQLATLLGEASGRHLWRLARGLDERPVVADREAKSISAECTFAVDLDDGDSARGVVLAHSESVGRRLRRSNLVATTVKLKLRYPDFTTVVRQARTASPTDDDMALYGVAADLLDRAWDRQRPIRLLGVGAAGLRPAGGPRQSTLFGAPTPRAAKLTAAIDAIRDRFGRAALRRGGTM